MKAQIIGTIEGYQCRNLVLVREVAPGWLEPVLAYWKRDEYGQLVKRYEGMNEIGCRRGLEEIIEEVALYYGSQFEAGVETL